MFEYRISGVFINGSCTNFLSARLTCQKAIAAMTHYCHLSGIASVVSIPVGRTQSSIVETHARQLPASAHQGGYQGLNGNKVQQLKRNFDLACATNSSTEASQESPKIFQVFYDTGMDILKIIREGLVLIADSYTNQREYVRPQQGPERDRAKLASDVRTVGKDLKQSIATYGEQSYERARDERARTSAFY